MKIASLSVLAILLAVAPTWGADGPQVVISGLASPESVCAGPDGAFYVTEIGEFGKDGDGQVSVIRDGKKTSLVSGLDDPKGIALLANKTLFVADKTRVLKIELDGKQTTFAAPDAFPVPPKFLNDVAVELQSNMLYVTDSGDLQGAGGAVFGISLRSGKVETVIDTSNLPGLHTPNGLATDGSSHLLLLDFGTGDLYRIAIASHKADKIADGFDGGDGLAWDKYGKLFISSWKTGKIWGIARPREKPVLLSDKFEQAADICVDATDSNILIPDMKAGTLTALSTTIPGWEVDRSPIAVHAVPAFEQLEWTGWKSENDSGLATPLRPILLTHAGDGSNRTFVPTQQGIIHVFPNDDKAAKTKVFLDISAKVRYSDRQNEEGFLGLAFHPKFKSNGEFFVFYTDVKAKMANVVSRFRVSKTDPDRADPDSEEEIIRFEKPFWNHDGGTIVFGPEGFLYITHGDGGAGGDPRENGQNLKTWLGKVLRVDIDRKSGEKAYGIPTDNPFIGRENAAPEVWAYGLRNIWRMAFDQKTGQLWASDVGQNLHEEIDILTAGGNFGWSIREGLHPFGPKGVDVRRDLIDPILEYHHDLGKSITGGFVYRGKQLPEIDGAYLYADYVTSRIWALWYDPAKKRVVANREIRGPGLPIVSFGMDEAGEAYVMTPAANGRGLYRLVKGGE